MAATPTPSIRWTLTAAEAEFPISRDTLSRRLHQLGEQPNDAGTYSTHQIIAAVFGDAGAEKARLAREQADRVAFDNAQKRGEFIAVVDAVRLARRYVHAVRQKIVALTITEEEKQTILAELRRLADENFTKIDDGTE